MTDMSEVGEDAGLFLVFRSHIPSLAGSYRLTVRLLLGQWASYTLVRTGVLFGFAFNVFVNICESSFAKPARIIASNAIFDGTRTSGAMPQCSELMGWLLLTRGGTTALLRHAWLTGRVALEHVVARTKCVGFVPRPNSGEGLPTIRSLLMSGFSR